MCGLKDLSSLQVGGFSYKWVNQTCENVAMEAEEQIEYSVLRSMFVIILKIVT